VCVSERLSACVCVSERDRDCVCEMVLTIALRPHKSVIGYDQSGIRTSDVSVTRQPNRITTVLLRPTACACKRVCERERESLCLQNKHTLFCLCVMPNRASFCEQTNNC
jgi:hypothetical protein